MKKSLLLLSIGMSCFLISCKNQEAASGASKKNQETMRAVHTAIDSKDFGKLGDLMTEDVIDHSGAKGEIKGLANMKTELEAWTASMKDNKTEYITEMANDEYAMTWCRYTGTMSQDNPDMGMKAGDHFDMKSIELCKFKDGKVSEHWSFMEPGDMMKMMQGMQAPAASMPADSDSTKKDMKNMGDSAKKM